MAELLKANPQGLTTGEIRTKLGLDLGQHAQLDRRKRELKRWYVIRRERAGNEYRYFYESERKAPLLGGGLNQRIRAEVLRLAHGRCAMCGQTIDRHGITLVVDHKIPRDWGGSDNLDNLWALCETCNSGKKNLFASQDQALMKKVMYFKSVHQRIGELLKAYKNKAVPSYLIEFVANQEDWRKRLRELRYLGWNVLATRKKNASARVDSFYMLTHFEPWPKDPTKWIRDYEKNRASRSSGSG